MIKTMINVPGLQDQIKKKPLWWPFRKPKNQEHKWYLQIYETKLPITSVSRYFSIWISINISSGMKPVNIKKN